MTTYYDIPANMLISALADKLSDSKDIVAPDWSEYVKTGVDRERPPTQENWWTIRTASLLRKVAMVTSKPLPETCELSSVH